ncbi:hypothetical protein BZA05DRAFT_360374, partial [Tricharina praecox]|uniref:uncharacterized protein n=1 Tax=Tricharina praecox TaxID=43433 RepID=UPI00221E9884
MNTDAHRVYHDTTHFEFAGGEFHGGQTFISGSSKRARSSEILEWISTIPYTSHHRRISERRLQGTGDWIFRKAEYCTWKSSGVSMLLLLRGIPGAGKTFLASRVIDSFLANPIPNSKLAFFYCDQGEDNRRDPEMIMRTLVQQLALARSENIELLKPAIAIYEDREKKGQRSSQLSLTESQQLLIDLINMYSQQTIIICIDALDEVDSAIRIQLLSSLKHVMEGSKNPVKIFATTRMDFDILRQFEMFPRIELHPDDNIDDISRFVKTEVRNNIGKRLLLDGVVDGGLKDDICNVLCHRSKGMFQLAALQIDFLSEMTTQDDVRRGLRALPDTLAQAYDAIYKRILRQKGNAPQLALNAFRWIQCSNEPLRSETLLDAIAIQIGGPEEPFHKDTPMKANELLKACQNLLILDERLNVFRFAHLSVDEYLETKLCRGECHTEIAKVCLSLLCTSWDDYDTALQTQEGDYSDRHLLLYAAVFWPWHLSRADDRCDILHASWANFVSDGNHERWFFYHYRVTPEFRKKARIGRLRARFGSRQTFTAVFGSRSAEGARVDRLLLCAARFGDPDIAGKLLDVGANIAAVDKGNWTSLHLAFKEGHEAVARLLIDRGADISTVGGYSGRTPLQLAALGGYEAVARVLLDRGADVSLADSAGNTPLHIALETGHDA